MSKQSFMATNRQHTNTPAPLACPFCGQDKIVRCGVRKTRACSKQLYQCKGCLRRFSNENPSGCRTPPHVMRRTLSLVCQDYTYDEAVCFIAARLRLRISKSAVSKWVTDFNPPYLAIRKMNDGHKPIIRAHLFTHRGLNYNYQVHQPKLAFCKWDGLTRYLNWVPENLDGALFEEGARCSELKLARNPGLYHAKNTPLNRLTADARRLAATNRDRHTAVEDYFIACDLITTVSNTFGTATISAFNYENDGFGRRTARVDATPTLTVNNAFGYNCKSEVISATMGENAYNYDFDPIGNRVFSSLNALTNTYSANALNQYSILQPKDLQTIKLSYDLDGNMVTNGIWSYTWDAENRLVAVYSNDTLLVSNIYDHQSRRIVKNLHTDGTKIRSNVFVWNEWNMVQELINDHGSTTTNFFTWGLDLNVSLQGAGGVGGLLAVSTGGTVASPSVYFPCYDANGNVTEFVDVSGTIRAHYAFDAFGNSISQADDMADSFTYRFSTKYFDSETGFYYYGYRFYAPGLGRWVNRDPGDEDGDGVYRCVDNDPIDGIDVLGLYADWMPIITTGGFDAKKMYDAQPEIFKNIAEHSPDKMKDHEKADCSKYNNGIPLMGSDGWSVEYETGFGPAPKIYQNEFPHELFTQLYHATWIASSDFKVILSGKVKKVPVGAGFTVKKSQSITVLGNLTVVQVITEQYRKWRCVCTVRRPLGWSGGGKYASGWHKEYLEPAVEYRGNFIDGWVQFGAHKVDLSKFEINIGGFGGEIEL
jgi:RHS repeat-associated protein